MQTCIGSSIFSIYWKWLFIEGRTRRHTAAAYNGWCQLGSSSSLHAIIV